MKLIQLLENSSEIIHSPSEEISGWLEEWGNKYKQCAQFNADGSVSLPIEITIFDYMLNTFGQLPFKIKTSKGITFRTQQISSFKNFPDIITGPATAETFYCAISCYCDINSYDDAFIDYLKLTSLEGITPIMSDNLNLRYCSKLNYSRVNKFVKEINGGQHAIMIDEDYVGPMLSFLNVKELEKVWQYSLEDTPLEEVTKIINKHLHFDRDILDCQEELITKGYKEYAKL